MTSPTIGIIGRGNESLPLRKKLLPIREEFIPKSIPAWRVFLTSQHF